MALMSILMMAAFSLIGVAVRNGWTLIVNRLTGNKDPDQQKLVRARAWTALAAIGGAGLILAYFMWQGLLMSVSFLNRQYALYIGVGLLVVGLNVARLMPTRRKIGLALAAIGALLVAYGAGYLG